jgi:hypothetical protein
MRHYLLVVVGDIEPELRGPFLSAAVRDKAAKRHKARRADADGLFRLDVPARGRPEVGAYPGWFFKGRRRKCPACGHSTALCVCQRIGD